LRLRIDLAVGLYIAQKVTLGKAARYAGLSRLEFQAALAERKIDLNLDESDLDEDIESLQRLNI